MLLKRGIHKSEYKSTIEVIVVDELKNKVYCILGEKKLYVFKQGYRRFE